MSETLARVKRRTIEALCAAGIEPGEARREAVLILEHVCQWNATQQLFNVDLEIDERACSSIDEIVSKREQRCPLSYILEHAWFLGLKLAIVPGVFIPRSDTETLVIVVEELLKSVEAPAPRLLEIGAGSGAISIALLARNKNLRITACDIDRLALDITAQNARSHNVQERLDLILSDWRALSDLSVDGIVSNPPYIPLSEKPNLQPEVGRNEPAAALFGEGVDGLNFYRELARDGKKFLAERGRFAAVEVGDGQAEAVSGIFLSNKWKRCDVHFDMNPLPRVVAALAQ